MIELGMTHPRTRQGLVRVLLVVMASCLISACNQVQPLPSASVVQPQSSAPPFLVTTTIREIMDAEVDPSADALWDSVAMISTLQGTTELQPRTPEEWKAVRRKAVTLLESMNLVIMEGRRIAPANLSLAPGELSPSVLQKKLDASQARFTGYAVAIRLLSQEALDAIDAKDPKRLFDVGGKIDSACETCHLEYWYPSDSRSKT